MSKPLHDKNRYVRSFQTKPSHMVHSSIVSPILFTLALIFSTGMIYLLVLISAQIMTIKASSAPAGWLIGLFLFQASMVLAYIYAHLITRLPRIRHQIGFHVMLWLSASSFLPLSLGDGWTLNTHASPVLDLFLEYVASIAAPLLFLTANLLLIQSWYGRTSGPSSKDPYFLYGTASFGGLIVLAAYPTILEPMIGVPQLSKIWSYAFIFMGAFILLSAFWTTRSHPDARTVIPIIDQKSDIRVIFGWILLTLIPSSLLHIYTREMSLVLGSYSSVWVVPLSLYLVSFITGFQSKPLIADRLMKFIYPLSVAVLTLSFVLQPVHKVPFINLIIEMVGFTLVSLHLHRRAYIQRPTADRLTLFYSILALGAAIGGLFASIISPLIMDSYHEIILILILATAIGFGTTAKETRLSQGFLIAIAFTIVGVSAVSSEILFQMFTQDLLIFFIMASSVCMVFRNSRPFATILMCVIAIITIGQVDRDPSLLHQSRGFFGSHDVTETEKYIRLKKNQSIIGSKAKFEDIEIAPFQSKYHSSREIYKIFQSDYWYGVPVAISGLGAGEVFSLASNRSEALDVFEVDAEIVELFMSSKYFTSPQQNDLNARIFNGDVRDYIKSRQSDLYGGILIDVASHSVLPLHLVTVDGISSLLSGIEDDGAIIYYTERSHYNLNLPLSAAAHEAGVTAYGLPRDSGENARFSLVAITKHTSKPSYLDDTWERLQGDLKYIWRDGGMNPLPTLAFD